MLALCRSKAVAILWVRPTRMRREHRYQPAMNVQRFIATDEYVCLTRLHWLETGAAVQLLTNRYFTQGRSTCRALHDNVHMWCGYALDFS